MPQLASGRCPTDDHSHAGENMLLNRRHTLGLFGAAAGSLILPRRMMARGERPSITIAVQKISNNNSLDC